MDFFRKNLEETIAAVNKFIRANDKLITVKKIRRENQIRSTDRSKINFIWRSLKLLAENNKITENGSKNPKSYKIIVSHEIDITDVLPE